MLRRTLLLGAAGAFAGTRGGRSASAVLGSTMTSTLEPRAVTPLRPVAAVPPPAVTGTGRTDYVFTRAARTLHTRVWYPDGPGPYPVVVFSHGLESQPDDYADLLQRWALAGFVVAAPLYPHTSLGAAAFTTYDIVNQPADASAVLTQLFATPLAARLDRSRLAAAGHSAGGITTAGLFSAHRDRRLTAGVLLAGTDFLSTPFSGPPAGLLFVQGAQDRTVAWTAAHTVYRAVPWSRAMLTVTGGGHHTTAAELPAVAGTSAAFLRWSLYGTEPVWPAPDGVATLDDQRSV